MSGIIKFLAIIFIIGLFMVASSVILNIARMNARDAVRVADIASIKLALVKYLKDSPTGYPVSTGECLRTDSGVGHELMEAKVLPAVPTDPLWPKVAPTQTNGVSDLGQVGFCYFYYSGVSDQFKISFFLESNSKAGRSGPQSITQ